MPSVRKRRRKRAPETGELFQIVHDGTVLVEKTLPSEGAALSLAQDLMRVRALKGPSEDPIEYIVRLRPVLGPPDDLYVVTLTCVGAIWTTSATAIDRAR